ncbi:MAG: methanogenesis marker protein 11 [Actinomycetota bacterium]
MAETLTPEDVRERYGDLPFITPYSRIVALLGRDGLVELHEFHARDRCGGGAAWEVYHYARTSPLVLSARREGARNIFVCEQGRCELKLEPGIAGAGLEEVRVSGDEVEITYAGLAGGGVAATLCRGMADNVISTVVHERGGGATMGRATLRVPVASKLVIGVDDTDDDKKGATWSTMNELSFELEQEGACDYLGHVIVQLFPENPHKTTNCCSTAVLLGARPGHEEALAETIRGMLAARIYSDECGMAFYTRVGIPDELREYSARTRSRMVDIEETHLIARRCGVSLREVTGERGLIGALAALGAHDDPDGAVRIPRAGGKGG